MIGAAISKLQSAHSTRQSKPPLKSKVNLTDKLSFVDRLHALPTRTHQDEADAAKFLQTVISHQHPDADTPTWPHHDE